MNVEIGAEAALFPEKEYIKGIFAAVFLSSRSVPFTLTTVQVSNLELTHKKRITV
jgi:hypothetical protein